eukprot:2023855-Rhodomonas_salina.1
MPSAGVLSTEGPGAGGASTGEPRAEEPSAGGASTSGLIASLPTSESVSPGHVTHTNPVITFRYLPASQSEHVPDPLTPLYVPTVHAEHADPSTPLHPMLQMRPRSSYRRL